MSGIAGLFNVPGTPDELNTWSFSHSAHHQEISSAIFRLTSILVPDVLLDPINPEAVYPWLQQHQVLHDQINEILGIEGYDLTDVDWRDPNQLAGWIFLNANEHMQASDILHIG